MLAWACKYPGHLRMKTLTTQRGGGSVTQTACLHSCL